MSLTLLRLRAELALSIVDLNTKFRLCDRGERGSVSPRQTRDCSLRCFCGLVYLNWCTPSARPLAGVSHIVARATQVATC